MNISQAQAVHSFCLASASSWFQDNIAMHPSKSSKKPFSLSFFSSLSWTEEKGREREKKESRKMERSWVMDALCVSVIPNYWTLPFKASLRCISHFCLSDWWRAGSDWGHCVLNAASPVIQHYFRCCSRHSSALLFHNNVSDFYSVSCSVFKCIVSQHSGLLW